MQSESDLSDDDDDHLLSQRQWLQLQPCPMMRTSDDSHSLVPQQRPALVSTLLDDGGDHTQPNQKYTLNRLLVLVRLTRRLTRKSRTLDQVR